MSVPEFHAMAERVRAAGVKFIIEPHVRFVGQPGEQASTNLFTVKPSSGAEKSSIVDFFSFSNKIHRLKTIS